MKVEYRVIRMDAPTGRSEYAIYEVCRDEQGHIQQIADDPASPHGESMAELKDKLEQMRQALELPVLETEEVLESIETEYGKWLREQMRDSSNESASPITPKFSREEESQAERRRLEKIAARFAERRRNEPSDET